MCHSFGITTSGSLAAIFNFRHEVASTMIVGHSDVSYIVINPIVFATTCICKTRIVFVYLDFEHTTMSHKTASKTTKKFDPGNIGVAVGYLSLCAQELEVCLGAISPPSLPVAVKLRKNRCREKD